MTAQLTIQTDERGYDFCNQIANVMVKEFGITRDQAIARINWYWRHTGGIVGNDIVYHNDPETWAYDMYYGKSSKWWKTTEGLLPVPIPEE